MRSPVLPAAATLILALAACADDSAPTGTPETTPDFGRA